MTNEDNLENQAPGAETAQIAETAPAAPAAEPAGTPEAQEPQAAPAVAETTEDQPMAEETPAEPEAAEEEAEDPETGGDDPAATSSKPEEQLREVLESAKNARLAPADEDHAVQLLKQTVTGGPKSLPVTLEAILSLPWNVGVKAVSEVWPETKPAGRTRLINGLAKSEADTANRIRLSLARGLHAQDAAAALKLISGVCESMGGAQGGSSSKDRQVFANVMLGKARPWLMNISMADLKPAEAQKLITPALESCGQSPIFTQIWVLRWIAEAGKFDLLPPEHVEAIAKSISRWQPRWHKELRKIIQKLPEPLEAALASAQPSQQQAKPHAQDQKAEAAPASDSAETPAGAEDAAEAGEETPTAEESLAAIVAESPRPAPQPSQHRGSGRDRQQGFDLSRSLREIESYVGKLRSELQQAQSSARRRDDKQKSRPQQPGLTPEESDELRRYNHQLEEQNQELRQRIEELTSDHEDRAATLGIEDASEQFKSFLALKLKEDFADYTAISREALNEVVRRHAHEILGRIFAVLQAEGVRFEKPE